MDLFTKHRNHLAIVAAIVFGWGVGAVAAVTIFGCVAMFGALLWLVASESRRRSDDAVFQHR